MNRRAGGDPLHAAVAAVGRPCYSLPPLQQHHDCRVCSGGSRRSVHAVAADHRRFAFAVTSAAVYSTSRVRAGGLAIRRRAAGADREKNTTGLKDKWLHGLKRRQQL